MIQPNTREQFTYQDFTFLAGCVPYEGDSELIAHNLVIDPVLLTEALDEPDVVEAVTSEKGLDKHHSMGLLFYITSRQHLLLQGVLDPAIADYVAALLVAFSKRDRAWKIDDYDDVAYSYVVDLRLDGITESQSHRAFKLHAHLGNFSLWQSGLYPEHILSRGLTLDYFDSMGSVGFQKASLSPQAAHLHLTRLFDSMSADYLSIRTALNMMSETTGFKPCTL